MYSSYNECRSGNFQIRLPLRVKLREGASRARIQPSLMKSAVDNPVEATKTGMLRAKFTTAPARSDGRRMSQQIMEMDGSAAPGEERRRMLDMLRKIRHEHAMHLDEERAKYGGIVADLSATTHTQNSMLRRSRAQQAELKKELRKAARKEEMLESTAGALQKKMRSARQAQASMQIHAEEKHMELEKVRADATRLRTLLAKTESPTGSPSTGAAKDGGRTSPGSGGRRPITAPSNARRQRSRGGGEGRSGGGRGGGRGGESGAGARPQTSSASSGGRRNQRDRGERPRTTGAPTAAGSEEAAAAGGVATAPAGEEGNQVMFFDDGAAVEPTTGSALETKGEPRGGAGGEVGTGGAQGPSSESTNSRFKSAARRVVAANRSNKVEGGPVGGDASTSRELFPPEEVEAAASGDGAGGDDDGGDGGVSLAVALSGQTGPEAMKDANGNEMSHEEQNKRAKAAAAITGGSAKAKPSAAAPRMMPLRKYKLPALTDKAKILEQEKCLKVQIVCVRGRGKVWVQLYAREGCLGGCEGVWVQRNYAYTPPADLELKEKACTRIASLMRTRCLFRDSHPFVLPISLCPPRPRPAPPHQSCGAFRNDGPPCSDSKGLRTPVGCLALRATASSCGACTWSSTSSLVLHAALRTSKSGRDRRNNGELIESRERERESESSIERERERECVCVWGENDGIPYYVGRQRDCRDTAAETERREQSNRVINQRVGYPTIRRPPGTPCSALPE